MYYLPYFCFLIYIALVEATGGRQRNGTVMADIEITYRVLNSVNTVIAGLDVPPVGLRGLNFMDTRNFIRFTVSPPGVRCFLRKAMPEEGEGAETLIGSGVQEEDDEQSEPAFSSRNRYTRHLSPVFGKVAEDDNLSSSIDIAPLDQLWQRLLCFQTDGTKIKVLLEYETGDFELINIRPNRFGWVTKEIDGMTLSQQDIVRSTIIQAPSENVECAITGRSVIAFLRKPLKIFKLEKTLYERFPGGSYTFLICRRAIERD